MVQGWELSPLHQTHVARGHNVYTVKLNIGFQVETVSTFIGLFRCSAVIFWGCSNTHAEVQVGESLTLFVWDRSTAGIPQ